MLLAVEVTLAVLLIYQMDKEEILVRRRWYMLGARAAVDVGCLSNTEQI